MQSDGATSFSATRDGENGPSTVMAAAAIEALRELVRLKDEKDQKGETAFYRSRKDAAWDQARRILRDHDAAL